MAVVPSELKLPELARSAPPRGSGLPPLAKLYFGLVAVATAAAAFPWIADLGLHTRGWGTFFVLASAAAVAQLFVVTTSHDQSYHTAIVFLIAAALLLPPELVALMGIVQHVPEWLKLRYAWYIQTFNICNYTVDGLAAWGIARLVRTSAFGGPQLREALAGLAACGVFVVLNHAVLATMLYFGRGHRPKETGLFTTAALSTDLVLAALGIGLATFWRWNPWLIPFAIMPLVLIHRSLHVPRLEQEARVDAKTGLFNARHFASALSEELARARRFERPVSLIMADLDLLRDVNNTYGHLAGDAVLAGIAQAFRAELRHYDVPARFGGEEFAILLPETRVDEAMEIAERIRRAVAERRFDVETSSEPIHVTVSMGVASFPKDGDDPNELVHFADLAVYRAKLQGRNRVVAAGDETLLSSEQPPRLVAVPERAAHEEPAAALIIPEEVRTELPPRPVRPTAVSGPRFFTLSGRLGSLVALTTVVGTGAGVAGLVLGTSRDLIGMIAIVALAGAGQALALEVDDGSISVGAVAALMGAALFGPRVALALAITSALVEWSSRRSPFHQVAFNVGALSLASLATAGVFAASRSLPGGGDIVVALSGLVAGAAYYAVNMGLLSLALAVEGRERWFKVWHERFAWLLPHYVAYGLVGGVMAIAYHAAGLYALAVSAVPLLLMRKTQAAYLSHTQRSAQKLREAAETIQTQNVSLEQANRLLKERSTAAMESLSATVDARDAYTAGHSRRVQQISLAIGRELGLSAAELDLLGHAALFHDIGKLAIPDAILLKPASLTPEEWREMKRHAAEGARIIDRLGFLADAVPAIRHHHERFDGSGYPDGLHGEEIPLGARIIHVADAYDSMLTARTYRAARPPEEAMEELATLAGVQFCPRCVRALESIVPPAAARAPELLAAS